MHSSSLFKDLIQESRISLSSQHRRLVDDTRLQRLQELVKSTERLGARVQSPSRTENTALRNNSTEVRVRQPDLARPDLISVSEWADASVHGLPSPIRSSQFSPSIHPNPPEYLRSAATQPPLTHHSPLPTSPGSLLGRDSRHRDPQPHIDRASDAFARFAVGSGKNASPAVAVASPSRAPPGPPVYNPTHPAAYRAFMGLADMPVEASLKLTTPNSTGPTPSVPPAAASGTPATSAGSRRASPQYKDPFPLPIHIPRPAHVAALHAEAADTAAAAAFGGPAAPHVNSREGLRSSHAPRSSKFTEPPPPAPESERRLLLAALQAAVGGVVRPRWLSLDVPDLRAVLALYAGSPEEDASVPASLLGEPHVDPPEAAVTLLSPPPRRGSSPPPPPSPYPHPSTLSYDSEASLAPPTQHRRLGQIPQASPLGPDTPGGTPYASTAALDSEKTPPVADPASIAAQLRSALLERLRILFGGELPPELQSAGLVELELLGQLYRMTPQERRAVAAVLPQMWDAAALPQTLGAAGGALGTSTPPPTPKVMLVQRPGGGDPRTPHSGPAAGSGLAPDSQPRHAASDVTYGGGTTPAIAVPLGSPTSPFPNGSGGLPIPQSARRSALSPLPALPPSPEDEGEGASMAQAGGAGTHGAEGAGDAADAYSRVLSLRLSQAEQDAAVAAAVLGVLGSP